MGWFADLYFNQTEGIPNGKKRFPKQLMNALEEHIALNTGGSHLVYSPPPKKKSKFSFSMPTSNPKKSKSKDDENERPEMIGNSVDGALIWMLTKCMKYEKDYYIKIRNAAMDKN